MHTHTHTHTHIYIYIYIYICIYTHSLWIPSVLLLSFLRNFHTSISWWFLTGVWEIASFLKSPGLFSVFWQILIMVSTRPLISSSPCTNPLVTVPSASVTIGITFTFMFHCFFSSLARTRYLSLFIFFSFTQWPEQQSPLFGRFSFFMLTFISSCRLVEIWWSVCISKSQRSLFILFSRTDSELCIYHFFVWSNLNFLHNSQ